jgi:hypothetical protein
VTRARIAVVAVVLGLLGAVWWGQRGNEDVSVARSPSALAPNPAPVNPLTAIDSHAPAEAVAAREAVANDAGLADGGQESSDSEEHFCEVVEGHDARRNPNDVRLRVAPEVAAIGTLTVLYFTKVTATQDLERDGGEGEFYATPGGMFEIRKRRVRVTRPDLTLARCGDHFSSLELVLDNGRGVRIDGRLDGGEAFLRPIQTAHLRGRLVFDGGVVESADVHAGNDWVRSDQLGRFDLAIYTDSPETVQRLFATRWLLDTSYELERGEISVRFAAGARVDLGDLQMRRKSLVPPGKVGIGWESHDAGTFIASVFTDSPAAQAGLKVGDQVVEVDGLAISTVDDAMRAIPGRPGSSVRLKVRREAEYLLFDVTRQGE